MGMSGFYDFMDAQLKARDMRKRGYAKLWLRDGDGKRHSRWYKKRVSKRPNWREIAPICLPGWFIGCRIQGVANLMFQVGPDVVEWLAPRLEELDDIPNPSRFQRVRLSALRWLLAEQECELEAIPEETPLRPSFVTTSRLSKGSAGVGSVSEGQADD